MGIPQIIPAQFLAMTTIIKAHQSEPPHGVSPLTAKQLRKQRQDDQEAKSFNEKVLKTLSRSRLAKFLKK